METATKDRRRFFWNFPPAGWIRKLQQAAVKVWFQTGSVDEAREAVDAGVDAIVAQGSEAGGHNRSAASLFALVPAMVGAVPVPVIAAGGIADGRGVAAALALGAEGVLVGTRFVASQEAHAHPEYKRRVVAARASDTVRTHIFGPEWPDAPIRVIRNRVVREWTGRDENTPPPDPPQVIGMTTLGGQPYPMPKFSPILPTKDTSGDFDGMCLAAGESAAGRRHPARRADRLRDDGRGGNGHRRQARLFDSPSRYLKIHAKRHLHQPGIAGARELAQAGIRLAAVQSKRGRIERSELL